MGYITYPIVSYSTVLPGLPGIDAIKDLHIRDIDLVEDFRHLNFLEESLVTNYGCIHGPNFDQNVSTT
jgi:hypothetical protein